MRWLAATLGLATVWACAPADEPMAPLPLANGVSLQRVLPAFDDRQQDAVSQIVEVAGFVYVGLESPQAGVEVWRSADLSNWQPVMAPGSILSPPIANHARQPWDQSSSTTQIHQIAPRYNWDDTIGGLVYSFESASYGARLLAHNLENDSVFELYNSGFAESTRHNAATAGVMRRHDPIYWNMGLTLRPDAGFEILAQQNWQGEFEVIVGDGASVPAGLGSDANREALGLLWYSENYYVATDSLFGAEIWRTADFVTWENVSPLGDRRDMSTDPTEPINNLRSIHQLILAGDQLCYGGQGVGGFYVGCSSDGEMWTTLVGPGSDYAASFGRGGEAVLASLTYHSNQLYVGTRQRGGFEVYRLDLDGSNAEQVIGFDQTDDALMAGLGSPDAVAATSLGVFDDTLLLGIEDRFEGFNLLRVTP